ncbi:MAG: stage II sporulation protein E [Alkaliphilus sp.]
MAERNLIYFREKSYFNFLMQKNLILLFPMAFLLGRASILENLTPFGIAFFVALYNENKKYLIIGLVTLAGILSTQGIYNAIPYGVFVLTIILTFNYKENFCNKKTYHIAITGVCIYVPIKLLFLLMDTFSLYDMLMIVFELLVIFTSIFITSYAMSVITQKNGRQTLTTEEIICVAILVALAISGLGRWEVYGVMVSNVIGILIIMIFAYSAGTGAGAAIGITVGLITSMSSGGGVPTIVGTFAFSGLLAGLFKDLGKIGCTVGFSIGAGIIAFYSNGYYRAAIGWQEILLAFVLFLIIPQTWFLRLKKLANVSVVNSYDSNNYRDEVNKKVTTRLIDFSETYNELSKAFETIVTNHEKIKRENMPELIEKVVDSVCENCGLKKVCWEENFLTTYKILSKLMVLIEREDEDGMTNDYYTILKKCVRVEQIAEAMTREYEISKANMGWINRHIEMKELMGEQLKGIALEVRDLAEELKEEVVHDGELKETIYAALDQAGLRVKNVLVVTNREGKLEISIEKNLCKSKYAGSEKYLEVISKTVGLKMVKKNECCSAKEKQTFCRIVLEEANRFMACTKVARIAKEGNFFSGDTFTHMKLKNGKYLAALSDGMGSGESAHLHSDATISMLEKMIDAGFGVTMTIETINSLLLFKSADEIFSSIDMTVIDLHEGVADFTKRGSVMSYIKRKNKKIDTITSSNLPIGIISGVKGSFAKQKLRDGDFIIMFSDGVIDAGEEDWLYEYLLTISTNNPQELANSILKKALEFTGEVAKDDMTVLVTKVWETYN